jgi:hypothetical protein
MTVAQLLRRQRGWGPKLASKILCSASLSERKTLGSLTERQRLMLATVLNSRERDARTTRNTLTSKRAL